MAVGGRSRVRAKSAPYAMLAPQTDARRREIWLGSSRDSQGESSLIEGEKPLARCGVTAQTFFLSRSRKCLSSFLLVFFSSLFPPAFYSFFRLHSLCPCLRFLSRPRLRRREIAPSDCRARGLGRGANGAIDPRSRGRGKNRTRAACAFAGGEDKVFAAATALRGDATPTQRYGCDRSDCHYGQLGSFAL